MMPKRLIRCIASFSYMPTAQISFDLLCSVIGREWVSQTK